MGLVYYWYIDLPNVGVYTIPLPCRCIYQMYGIFTYMNTIKIDHPCRCILQSSWLDPWKVIFVCSCEQQGFSKRRPLKKGLQIKHIGKNWGFDALSLVFRIHITGFSALRSNKNQKREKVIGPQKPTLKGRSPQVFGRLLRGSGYLVSG